MTTQQILDEINNEITRLKRVRDLLSGEPPKKKPARGMSAEARARISAAQRERWAKRKAATV